LQRWLYHPVAPRSRACLVTESGDVSYAAEAIAISADRVYLALGHAPEPGRVVTLVIRSPRTGCWLKRRMRVAEVTGDADDGFRVNGDFLRELTEGVLRGLGRTPNFDE
jgi:hypothetical protein